MMCKGRSRYSFFGMITTWSVYTQLSFDDKRLQLLKLKGTHRGFTAQKLIVVGSLMTLLFEIVSLQLMDREVCTSCKETGIDITFLQIQMWEVVVSFWLVWRSDLNSLGTICSMRFSPSSFSSPQLCPYLHNTNSVLQTSCPKWLHLFVLHIRITSIAHSQDWNIIFRLI
jgi:hypothetical protein